MTAAEIAHLLNARKWGKNKWIAKCVAHPDRKPSLAIAQGRTGVLLCCMSQRCSTKSILDAMGLEWSALFDGSPTPEIKRRQSLQGRWELLKLRLGAVRLCQVIDRSNRRYWEAAERRLIRDMEPVYWELMPDLERFNRLREFELKKLHVKRLDWLRERENHGICGAVGGPQSHAGDARKERIHDAPHQLQAGRLQGGGA